MADENVAPPAPPGPPAWEVYVGVSLLSQAFNQAGELDNVILAANIGGGLSRLQTLLRLNAKLQAEVTSVRVLLQAESRKVDLLMAGASPAEVGQTNGAASTEAPPGS